MDSSSPASNTISVKGTIPVASTFGSPSINFPSHPANDSSCDGKPISLWPGIEQYRDPWNEVRIGKLLEDLDVLAGTISVKHCSDDDSTTRPLLLVTASVDKIVLKKPISVDFDLKVVGSVIWVGRSSIVVQLVVSESKKEGCDDSDSIALTANFIFVARSVVKT
ncbi:hypothetical protein K1719_022929 [Acacia pycnantha]|nr:hypothetical protein K1719_022929 [Acacia pycnantha]